MTGLLEGLPTFIDCGTPKKPVYLVDLMYNVH